MYRENKGKKLKRYKTSGTELERAFCIGHFRSSHPRCYFSKSILTIKQFRVKVTRFRLWNSFSSSNSTWKLESDWSMTLLSLSSVSLEKWHLMLGAKKPMKRGCKSGTFNKNWNSRLQVVVKLVERHFNQRILQCRLSTLLLVHPDLVETYSTDTPT